MRLEKVTAYFCEMTELGETDAAKWQHLCENALTALSRRLKAEADTPENDERLAFAAASEAYYAYSLMTAESAPTAVKLGDVSVTTGGEQHDLRRAATLRDYGMDAVADCLIPGIFIRQVKAV